MRIRIASSIKPTITEAIAEVASRIQQDDINIIFIFASLLYNPTTLIKSLSQKFPHVPILGCTSAGEISPRGFIKNGLVVASIASKKIQITAELLPNLSNFDRHQASQVVSNCSDRLGGISENSVERSTLGILLIDGLSRKEEKVTSLLAMAYPSLRLIGGSASHSTKSKRTYVFFDDRCFSNAGLFILWKSEKPFEIINHHHFLPTGEEFVATEASPEKRIIYKINDRPAYLEYARMLGRPVKNLSELYFQHPFGYEIGDQYFIRSVVNISPQGLALASAVEEGTVLMLMKPGKIVEDTKNLMNGIKDKLDAEVGFMLLFNCLGRYFEMEAKGLTSQVFRAMKVADSIIGFNTFGEQYYSLHMNHSLTGVVFKK